MRARYLAFVVVLLAGAIGSGPAAAHCDTTKGPVVTAARAALEAGNADLVLHWVRPEDEPAVRGAFQHTMEVRALGPEAKELADRYFFETLVRIHRAGEGAPYTGLTEGDPEPIIAATDRALERGSAAEVEEILVSAVGYGLAARFEVAQAARSFRPGDVAGGRAFVAAYVPLTHWVEGVFAAARGTGDAHGGTTGHDPAAHAEPHAATHEPAGPLAGHEAAHAPPVATGESHHGLGLRHLPWLLVTGLAIVALVEGVFLVRRRRPVAT